MFNLNNYGVATGRLTADPFVYQNAESLGNTLFVFVTFRYWRFNPYDECECRSGNRCAEKK